MAQSRPIRSNPPTTGASFLSMNIPIMKGPHRSFEAIVQSVILSSPIPLKLIMDPQALELMEKARVVVMEVKEAENHFLVALHAATSIYKEFAARAQLRMGIISFNAFSNDIRALPGIAVNAGIALAKRAPYERLLISRDAFESFPITLKSKRVKPLSIPGVSTVFPLCEVPLSRMSTFLTAKKYKLQMHSEMEETARHLFPHQEAGIAKRDIKHDVKIPPSDPPPSSGDSRPAKRFIQGRMPETVRVGTEVVVQIRIALTGGNDRSMEFALPTIPPEGLALKIVLHNPGFELLSESNQMVIVVPQSKDSDWGKFHLKAVREGIHVLEATVYHGGTSLGALPMQVTIERSLPTGESRNYDSLLWSRQRFPGEVTLSIRFDSEAKIYRYQFVDDSLVGPDEDTMKMMQVPSKAAEVLVKELNVLARSAVGDPHSTVNELIKGKGIDLWQNMMPESLKRYYWERREKISRMVIMSSGDPMPWELLYPFDGKNSKDFGFLAEQFPICRWFFGGRPFVDSLRLSRGGFVVGEGSPPAARAEASGLQALLASTIAGFGIVKIERLKPLLELFRDAQFDLLHFACHNSFKPSSPSASEMSIGEDSFQPTYLNVHKDRFRFKSPLVFMNACRTDGQAPSYTKMDGWAQKFIDAGAGMFLGSLWEVTDESAHLFAENFYGALLGGMDVGTAFMRSRVAVKGNGTDPTWLAYTCYGDPAAKIA